MRVVFMGTPAFSVPVLDALASRHEVAAVYTQPPRPAGRGRQDRPGPVHQRAISLGLPVRHPASLRGAEAQAEFAAVQADVAIVVAYGLILPQAVLDAPAKGCLNIHASLLPRWRGAAPIQRAVMAGDAETGICIMAMEAGLDTGPVLLRDTLPIGPETTTGDLHDALSAMGARLILKALDQLAQLMPEPQAASGITYAEKIAKSEAQIDWTAPAATVDCQIRGLSPFPGAWCWMAGERVKLLRSRLVGALDRQPPGTVLAAEAGLTVACGTGAVEVTEAQREGRRALPMAEVLRGLVLPPGTLLLPARG